MELINATKALSRVPKKGIHIKSCYASMDKDHLTRYQELQHFKAAQRGAIQDYSENSTASISILQNKSSAVIKYTIRHISKSITLSNDTKIYEMSYFISASNITTEINPIINSNDSLIFGIDSNAQKPITSNYTRLTIAIADIIFGKVFCLILTKNQDSRR